MSNRYRTHLVLKLFPSVPKGLFGTGRFALPLTSWLEKHVFYREFEVSPRTALLVAVSALCLAAWAVVALVLAVSVLWRAEGLREEIARQQANLTDDRVALNESRRDYYMLLARLEPLNEQVDK